ncbi:MAG: signal peptidase I [Armatimonadota bacterium]
MRKLSLFIPLLLIAAGCSEKAFRMGSDVMLPTISAGDTVVVNRSAYINEEPERADIVLYEIPDIDVERISILRVVAVGGDTIRVQGGKLYVNDMDEPVDEPYIKEPMRYTLEDTTVPDGHVYVLGDNRNDSNDSQRFGPLSVDDVVGKVVKVEER